MILFYLMSSQELQTNPRIGKKLADWILCKISTPS